MINRFHFSEQVMNIRSPSLDRVGLRLACLTLGIEELCDQDYKFLEEYATIIKPIANAITFLEGCVQTFGSYLPMLFSVRQELKDLYIDDELEYCRPLLLAVRDGFHKRFAHLMDLSSPFERGDPKAIPLFIAMITNPEYKINFIPIDWFYANAEGMNQIKSILLNAMKKHLEDEKQQQVEENANDSSPDENTNAKPSKQGMPIKFHSEFADWCA